ncbi:TPA: hypothetical protein QCU33_005274 [Bacillus cereus]|nr:hypothetical protein [Bacillus cereus]
MQFNKEQQKFFDTCVEMYELYESTKLTGGMPFLAAGRKQFYKSAVALVVLNQEKIMRFEETVDYEEALITLSGDHPARVYYKGIVTLGPGIKATITSDFKHTMMWFWNLIEESQRYKEREKDGMNEENETKSEKYKTRT